jgi:type III secretion system HrpE/YscL family protein
MSFLLWHRDRSVGIAAGRSVLRANEVPLFADAQQLCERLEQLNHDKVRYIAQAGDEARATGFAEGRDEGRRAGRDEIAAQLAAMTRAAAEERDRLRGEVGLLALQVVRKLMGQVAPDAVLAGLAATAVRDMLPTQTMTLFVHPDQCDAVRARVAAGAEGSDESAARIDVQPDPDCAEGTCRIETEHGAVDASLETQLGRLADAWGLTDH